MNRRGIALLIALWLIVLLSGVTVFGLSSGKLGGAVARNRTALLRGAWAAESCFAIAQARATGRSYSRDLINLEQDSIDLGGGIWCRFSVRDPAARLDVNRVQADALLRLVGDSLLVQMIMHGRPWPAVEALPRQLGPWVRWLTVRGMGRVNLNLAPAEVLATLPGLDPAGVRAILAARNGRRELGAPEDLYAVLPESSRQAVVAAYVPFMGAAAFRTERLIAVSEGHAVGSSAVARVTLTLVPVNGRLAVLQRESE